MAMATVFVFSAAAESEPNDNRSQANPLILNASGQATTSGKVNPLSDLDFYSIVTPPFSGQATLTITMTPTSSDQALDAKVQLLNSAGTLLAEKDSGLDNVPETLTFAQAAGNTTYFHHLPECRLCFVGFR